MGQYYEAVIADPMKRKAVKNYRKYVPYDFDNGAKLMEHSYIGTNITGEVENHIYEYGPRRIMWFGDYTYDDPSDCIDAKNRNGILPTQTEVAKIQKNEPEFFSKTLYNDEFVEKYKNSFLVNHTQKLYIDMARYWKENRTKQKCYIVDAPTQPTYEWRTWCVDPLPILTATVNHSGGSYYGPNEDKACSWTWDIIAIEDEPPASYKEVMYHFKECA